MVERLSLSDKTLLSAYGDHIQRYRFAERFCIGQRILDAGCGIGYGSHHLAANGARSVHGLDISPEAISEASQLFVRSNLSFQQADVHNVGQLTETYDAIVNFENLEHLTEPERFISGAARISKTLITSTPNGDLTVLNSSGNPANQFHVKEFTADELIGLLSPYFSKIDLYGQWLTHAGRLRQIRAKELFDQLNEQFYNPMNRIGRFVKRMAGKQCLPPLGGDMLSDSMEGDYSIEPLSSEAFPWKPTTLIAVCFSD
jgi:2-polyprenyl-3-methyl-5-hydroxy-6-metoxy-1,4-benzoquinol methylase